MCLVKLVFGGVMAVPHFLHWYEFVIHWSGFKISRVPIYLMSNSPLLLTFYINQGTITIRYYNLKPILLSDFLHWPCLSSSLPFPSPLCSSSPSPSPSFLSSFSDSAQDNTWRWHATQIPLSCDCPHISLTLNSLTVLRHAVHVPVREPWLQFVWFLFIVVAFWWLIRCHSHGTKGAPGEYDLFLVLQVLVARLEWCSFSLSAAPMLLWGCRVGLYLSCKDFLRL